MLGFGREGAGLLMWSLRMEWKKNGYTFWNRGMVRYALGHPVYLDG